MKEQVWCMFQRFLAIVVIVVFLCAFGMTMGCKPKQQTKTAATVLKLKTGACKIIKYVCAAQRIICPEN